MQTNTNNTYIDGFVFPILKKHIKQYQSVAIQIAKIWKEYGAIAYYEYIGEDLQVNGTKSFVKTMQTGKDEEIVFGWMVFPSKAIRDQANKQIPEDPRIKKLIASITQPNHLIFNSSRMLYGGFKNLIQVTNNE